MQEWLGTIALLSAIVVPLIGIWGLQRWSAGRRGWRLGATWVGGCLTMLVYGTVAFVFAVCWGGGVGESGKSRLARAYGTPVVAALEEFHRDSGAYPAALRTLVPRYLSRPSLTAPDSSVLGYPLEYRADSGTFSLTVRYVGPGMNTCRIRHGTAWRCSGYF
jgi:hypothetical protein